MGTHRKSVDSGIVKTEEQRGHKDGGSHRDRVKICSTKRNKVILETMTGQLGLIPRPNC